MQMMQLLSAAVLLVSKDCWTTCQMPADRLTSVINTKKTKILLQPCDSAIDPYSFLLGAATFAIVNQFTYFDFDIKMLELFYISHRQPFLDLHWWKKMPDAEIRRHAHNQPMEVTIVKHQLV